MSTTGNDTNGKSAFPRETVWLVPLAPSNRGKQWPHYMTEPLAWITSEFSRASMCAECDGDDTQEYSGQVQRSDRVLLIVGKR